MAKSTLAGCMVVLILVSLPSIALADQVVFIDVTNLANMEEGSQFGVDVDGNTWIRVSDPSSLNGKVALGDPGDSSQEAANPPGAPFLVYKFPQDVRAGESTADGKTWVPWAHMRVPTTLNSFFWQVSTDNATWKPESNTDVNRWNDDGRNNSNAWYWQDNVTGNAGAINADIAVGVNYFRLGVRESSPTNHPLIDVVCFRNDGNAPTDAEALASGVAVEPAGKLAALWGQIKARY